MTLQSDSPTVNDPLMAQFEGGSKRGFASLDAMSPRQTFL
jgi:hypothetical protein